MLSSPSKLDLQNSGMVRRLTLVGAHFHGRRDVLSPQPGGIPGLDRQRDGSDAEIGRVHLTVADSENSDAIAPSQATPGHRLLGDSDTESLSDGVSIASVRSTNPVVVLPPFLGVGFAAISGV